MKENYGHMKKTENSWRLLKSLVLTTKRFRPTLEQDQLNRLKTK